MNNFYMNNKSGKIGEQAVISLLKQLNFKYKNVSNDKKYQKEDVDFLAINSKKQLVKIEAKFDSKDFGNILVEYISNDKKKTAGWGLATKADFVTVYKQTLNTIYILNAKKLKQFVQTNISLDINSEEKCAIKTATTGTATQLYYKSWNLCIARTLLIKHNIIVAKYVYKKNIWQREKNLK